MPPLRPGPPTPPPSPMRTRTTTRPRPMRGKRMHQQTRQLCQPPRRRRRYQCSCSCSCSCSWSPPPPSPSLPLDRLRTTTTASTATHRFHLRPSWSRGSAPHHPIGLPIGRHHRSARRRPGRGWRRFPPRVASMPGCVRRPTSPTADSTSNAVKHRPSNDASHDATHGRRRASASGHVPFLLTGQTRVSPWVRRTVVG